MQQSTQSHKKRKIQRSWNPREKLKWNTKKKLNSPNMTSGAERKKGGQTTNNL